MVHDDLLASSQAALTRFILSASGWRTVFAPSGDEEDGAAALSPIHTILAGLMAKSFLDNLQALTGKPVAKLCVALGTDTRPTGPALVRAMLPAFIATGCELRHVGVSAAPEIMAWSRVDPAIDAFVYISASHNPVGHNGVKFGLDTGGVLNAAQVKPLIAAFQALAADQGALRSMAALQAGSAEAELQGILAKTPAWKAQALDAYRRFSGEVIADSADAGRVKASLGDLAAGIARRPVGLVGDLNGSARCSSIDRDFLAELGVATHFFNDKAGLIAHRIVPEGASLDHCRQELARQHAQDERFVLGYMPDNDGDRGNLVYWDAPSASVKALEAQEVFALCCLAELAYLVHAGQLRYDERGKALDKVAIAVNDPTSMRIDELARSFGAEVFRAEVGEANVVNLAASLREKGYLVRILGEGSNGGNITHPAAVRDPLNTIASMLKLLTMTGAAGKPGLFAIWCQRRGIPVPAQFGLAEVIASLPAWVTTSAYEDRAILRIKSLDHARLKAAYETAFLQAWERDQKQLRDRFGISSWEEFNYEGIEERSGFGPAFRSAAARGGFKILFRNAAKDPVAMVWMRGSGTEPVFRVAAELRGGSVQDETWLLDWHKALIAAADA